MAIALVAHTGQNLGGTGGTTTGIDTTGADLLVIGVAYGGNPTLTVSDSKSNTWTALNKSNGSGVGVVIYYAKNATSGTSHTFTVTGGDGAFHGFISVCVNAFSGSNTTAPFDQQNNSGSAGTSSTRQPGSVTPGEDNEVLITNIGDESTNSGTSIDGGFTISDYVNNIPAQGVGTAMAYLIQTSAAAANPTWTLASSQLNSAGIATFKAGTGGGSITFKAAWCKNTNVVQSIGRGF